MMLDFVRAVGIVWVLMNRLYKLNVNSKLFYLDEFIESVYIRTDAAELRQNA